MKTQYSTIESTTVAASVAPEDLKCGDFVAISHEWLEFPSFMWDDPLTSDRDVVRRVRSLPAGAGMPLKVKAICLPFVFVKPPAGPFETLDVRRVQLVRLDSRYGKTVWRCLREQPAKPDTGTAGSC